MDTKIFLAREASRRIVEDLLLTAGADLTDSIAEDDENNLRPGISKIYGDDSDPDINADFGFGNMKGGESRGGGAGGIDSGRGGVGRRIEMKTTTKTTFDDSPSIVRKRDVHDDDEF